MNTCPILGRRVPKTATAPVNWRVLWIPGRLRKGIGDTVSVRPDADILLHTGRRTDGHADRDRGV